MYLGDSPHFSTRAIHMNDNNLRARSLLRPEIGGSTLRVPRSNGRAALVLSFANQSAAASLQSPVRHAGIGPAHRTAHRFRAGAVGRLLVGGRRWLLHAL